jgi:hypothetical protein
MPPQTEAEVAWIIDSWIKAGEVLLDEWNDDEDPEV